MEPIRSKSREDIDVRPLEVIGIDAPVHPRKPSFVALHQRIPEKHHAAPAPTDASQSCAVSFEVRDPLGKMTLEVLHASTLSVATRISGRNEYHGRVTRHERECPGTQGPP